mgnify:FL=1
MPETDTTDQASLCELPAIGQPLMGGTFAGITTQADGTHCAVILLASVAPDGAASHPSISTLGDRQP